MTRATKALDKQVRRLGRAMDFDSHQNPAGNSKLLPSLPGL
jgi:hypothetical protein